MQLYAERCDECSPRSRCGFHIECTTHRDAAIAADVGTGWARFVWGQLDVRLPWPEYGGRCAAIADRLVAWLAETDARRIELARICCWKAGMSWTALLAKIRDRPFRQPDGKGVLYRLPRHDNVVIEFRPRLSSRRARGGSIVALTEAALEHTRVRARRWREAQGLQNGESSPPTRAVRRR